ncbi:histidine kinase [Desulfonatronum sp. SC1]|nr:histidine kinase [Desulfonatronum sp. SC1]
MVIPQQKRTFLLNLESKANSVAVSLRDVAAGAAVNEDFASVISASLTLIQGDPEIDFLVVMKNDGYSLINDHNGWRVEPQAGPYWHPSQRVATGAIAAIPDFSPRTFHYAQPFDYSGIEWGWIHVGLSLASYDQSVATLYRNTLILALGCILFSFAASLFYARQLVQPILRLRGVVQRIADGDLTVRADVARQDELGALAVSVNTMAEALLRRDRILEGVRFAAQQFVQTGHWQSVIDQVLARLGQASEASRAYIFKNHQDNVGRLSCSLIHEWTLVGIMPQIHNPGLRDLPYTRPGLDHWGELFARGGCISGPVDEMSPEEQADLRPQGIKSLLAIPIFVDEHWWGFIGLDDCVTARSWSEPEKDSLRAAADIIGATIARQRVQDALLESKSTLEQRVLARTRELQSQVRAKERALAELAAAQSSLLEMSRAAGMAEVATGVLHNVGNVLNSVNVSCSLLQDQLRQSRVGNVAKVAEMLSEAEGELPRFLAEDSRGRRIPAYLRSLADVLQEEQKLMAREAQTLQDRVEHIKEIVSMQQTFGRISGVLEILPPEQLMEDALKLNAEALARHGITVRREYEPMPPVSVDKHKVLQILLNLITNAKYACLEGDADAMTITLALSRPASDRVLMQVVDNGMGIAPENLTRIFQHGFTTRQGGHGFGLHSGALAARELGGSLSVHSDGPGRGATFTLEFPTAGNGAQ